MLKTNYRLYYSIVAFCLSLIITLSSFSPVYASERTETPAPEEVENKENNYTEYDENQENDQSFSEPDTEQNIPESEDMPPPVTEPEGDIKQQPSGSLAEKNYPIGYPSYSGKNVTDWVSINEWNILDNSGIPLSADNPAFPNKLYSLYANFSLDIAGSDLDLGNEDYFILKLPVNDGPGLWNSLSTSWEPFHNGSGTTYGYWMILNMGTEWNELHVKFTDNVTGVHAISDIMIQTGKESLNNLTMLGGIYTVSFGSETRNGAEMAKKDIRFEQQNLYPIGTWDQKYAAYSSNRNILWQIVLGARPASSLAGYNQLLWNSEKNDYDYVSPETGWGERALGILETPSENVYVEDVLPPGVTINALYITTRALAPFDLQLEGERREGLPSWEPAYARYVLADAGSGPEHMESGAAPLGDLPAPSINYSFRLLEQHDGESYQDFKNRLKPWEYGYYTTPPATQYGLPQITLIIYFGNISSTNSALGMDQPKYSDLTETKWAQPERYISTGETSVMIPEFAARAAQNCIKQGFYNEIYRERLEEYFTFVYGDSNAINGRAVNFLIDVHTGYPPTITSDQQQNTVLVYADDFDQPLRHEGNGTLAPMAGRVSLQPYEACLYKYDYDTLKMLQGVEFKLQKKESDGSWSDYGTEVTNEYGYVLNSSLAPGSYRYYEVTPPQGYDTTVSQGYSAIEGTCLSEEFTITENDIGHELYLYNKAGVTKSYYQVVHLLEKEIEGSEYGTTYANAPDEGWRIVDDIPVGVTVTEQPRVYDGYVLDPNIPGSNTSGVVVAADDPEGILTLVLIYKKLMDFTFIKQDERGNNMEGAEFALYSCKYGGDYTAEHWNHSALVSDDPDCCWTDPITAVSGFDGTVSFLSLITGTYMLLETQTLTGYQLPLGQWNIYVNAPLNKIVHIAAAQDSPLPPAFGVNIADGLYFVRNYKIPDLPYAGGSGTILFTVGGVVLIGISALIFINIFRKKQKNN